MDLRKEITLKDLVPKRKPGAAKSSPKPAASKPERRPSLNDVVGLKVGATGLTAVHVVNDGGKQVVQIARRPLPFGLVDGGEVREPTALGAELDAFFAENELPRRNVRLGLANSRIGVRMIEIAGIEDENQLENAIGFRAHEMLSVPLDEAVIDYHVLSVDIDETGSTTRRILLVVAYRESIDRYLEATDAAKLELAGIDLEAFALLRAVSEPGETREAAIVAVNVGHERTTLAISDGSVCQFARVLEWGGHQLNSALGRALKVTPSEAEDVKQSLSLERGRERVVGLPENRSAEAVDAVRYELQVLVRELLSSLRFYQAQDGSLPLSEILLAGGTSAIPGLADELARELGLPVSVADPFLRVGLAEGVDRPGDTHALAVAVGLGIED